MHEVLNASNNLTPSTQFTLEEEPENKINFLDNTISKDDNNIHFSIYIGNPVQQMSSQMIFGKIPYLQRNKVR